MKRSTSRLLSTLLVLCMVLALLPGTAWAAGTTVHAGTVKELTAALKSNTTIILEGKDYVLEDDDYFQGCLSLVNLENVTIRGTTGTRILSTSVNDGVIAVKDCKNIALDDLVLGHDIPASNLCSAGVVYAYETEQLTITNCDIFGCGLVGIDGYSSTITVEKSTIRDCSEYILGAVVASMVFKDCIFSGNGYGAPEKYAVSVSVYDWDDRVFELAFYNCTFRDNKNPHFTNGSPVVENCTFTNNVWDFVVEIPVTGGSIYFSTATGDIVDCDSNVTKAVIPGAFNGVAVTGIGDMAFLRCLSLTSVTIPDSVTSIGYNAFNGCSSLTSVTIPSGVATIDYSTFSNCGSLTSVTIPASVTSIKDGAFNACHSLTSVTIPGNVISIGRYTFNECENLASVTIPTSVASIGERAFAGCESLTDVYYGGSESQWKQIEIDNTWNGNDDLLNSTIHYGALDTPDEPDIPDTPDVPDKPDTSDVPATPDEPDVPDTPDTPDTPDVPDEPDTPDTPTFTDVPAGAFYAEPVQWAVENGVTAGTGNGSFSPEDDCTRAQIVTFLWRAMGSPEPDSTGSSYSDVNKDSYYYKAVQWAEENGITSGVGGGRFGTDGGCTRAQVVTFLWRAHGMPAAQSGSGFSDVDDSAYYAQAVKWAVANNITAGTGNGKFSPDAVCTRAQIVTFLYRDLAEA